HRGGLHHQTAGFGDSHKETDDVGVSHGERTTVLYLLLKPRNHRTVAAQHIAETGGHEFGAALYLTITHGTTQTLNVNLSQTLGTAHYIRRIHGLVCRNHYHFLRTVRYGHVGHLARTGNIHQDGLAGILLHQRDVLVSGGVEYYLRMVKLKDHTHTFLHTHIAYHGNKIYGRIVLLKLQADIMQRGLCGIEHHQLADAHLDQLTAKLATDTAGGTGHKNDLALELPGNLSQVDVYLC